MGAGGEYYEEVVTAIGEMLYQELRAIQSLLAFQGLFLQLV